MLDLLITGGMIIDGTGSQGYYGAVGVEGDTLSLLRGDVSHVQAARTIDATGRVVCPGFIDMHSHAGLVILSEPTHEPKVHQGITTELSASTATPTRPSAPGRTSSASSSSTRASTATLPCPAPGPPSSSTSPCSTAR